MQLSKLRRYFCGSVYSKLVNVWFGRKSTYSSNKYLYECHPRIFYATHLNTRIYHKKKYYCTKYM